MSELVPELNAAQLGRFPKFMEPQTIIEISRWRRLAGEDDAMLASLATENADSAGYQHMMRLFKDPWREPRLPAGVDPVDTSFEAVQRTLDVAERSLGSALKLGALLLGDVDAVDDADVWPQAQVLAPQLNDADRTIAASLRDLVHRQPNDPHYFQELDPGQKLDLLDVSVRIMFEHRLSAVQRVALFCLDQFRGAGQHQLGQWFVTYAYKPARKSLRSIERMDSHAERLIERQLVLDRFIDVVITGTKMPEAGTHDYIKGMAPALRGLDEPYDSAVNYWQTGSADLANMVDELEGQRAADGEHVQAQLAELPGFHAQLLEHVGFSWSEPQASTGESPLEGLETAFAGRVLAFVECIRQHVWRHGPDELKEQLTRTAKGERLLYARADRLSRRVAWMAEATTGLPERPTLGVLIQAGVQHWPAIESHLSKELGITGAVPDRLRTNLQATKHCLEVAKAETAQTTMTRA